MANQEQTFIMIKPDGVARGLVGEIIKRFESKVLCDVFDPTHSSVGWQSKSTVGTSHPDSVVAISCGLSP